MGELAKHGQFAIIPARALDDVRFEGKPRHMYALLTLGTYADRDGWCWPSLKTIAERLGVTAPTVSNTMGDLAEWGYLLIVRTIGRPGEPNETNRYRIIHDADLPTEYDRTKKKTPIKSRAGESDTLLNPTRENLIPYKIPPSEILQNVPLNVPVQQVTEKPSLAAVEKTLPVEMPIVPGNTVPKEPGTSHADAEFAAMPSASEGMPPIGELTAAVASPQEERKAFIAVWQPKIAQLYRLDADATTARSVAAKLYDHRTVKKRRGRLDEATEAVINEGLPPSPYMFVSAIVAKLEIRKAQRVIKVMA